MSEKKSLSERIRTYALDIGYSRVGFIPVDDFDEYEHIMGKTGELYDWWLASPRKPLEWARPREMAPFAQSIIVLIYDYARVSFPAELCALMGRVYQSRSYLAPKDNINGARYQLLQDYITEQGLHCEDAAWLPQRWAGVRAGVTDFGHNTCAYAGDLGSFIVISTLLVDAQLDYAEPGPVSSCPENCTKCIDACPTQAFLEPFRLNPRRCLAFNAWMTSSRWGFGITDAIPRDIRPLMGQHIHGCDACQEACPRNARKLAANDARPHDQLLDLLATELRLEQILHLPEGYYESYIRPVMYNYIRDHSVFQRNAAVAIGNTHDPRYLSALAVELGNSNPTVRGHVVWALGRIGGDEAERLLRQRLETEEDSFVCEELALALSSTAGDTGQSKTTIKAR